MKIIKKAAAVVLSAALLTGTGYSALAAGNTGNSVSKDESVYSILNADGTVKKESVSCWLHADGGLSAVTDKSSLTNITNVKSAVAPKSSNGAVTWDTSDTDIYYTGDSDKTPPVGVNITYMLNGSPISAEDLIGKSGDIKMTFKFTNNEKQTKTIDGKSKTIYTPFAVGLVMDMPVKSFSSVKAGSSNIITDSENQIVDYVCLPGLRENFDGLLSDDLVTGLNDAMSGEFTVTAHTDSFQMPTVLIGAATNLADLQNINMNDKLTDLTGGIDKLSSAISQLKDGTAQLSAALGTYHSKMSELGSGYTQLNDGLLQAVAGADDLRNGTTQLNAAAGLLKQEVTTQLIPGISASQSQQKELVDKMTALQTQLAGLKIPDMSSIQAQLTAAVSSVCDASSNATIQVVTGGKTLTDLPAAQQAAIAGAKQKILTQAGTQITQMLSSLNMSSLQSLGQSLTEIQKLSGNLMSSMNALTTALYNPNDDPSNPKTLSGAIIAMSVGADRLNDGAAYLDDGLQKLKGGSDSVNTGLKALIDASATLAQKSGELNSGTETFKSKIDEMVGAGTADKLGEALDIKDEMVKQANAYGSFSGAPEGATTTIKFIMKIDDVASTSKQQTSQNNDNQKAEKLTFWQRIANFFKSIF